MDNTSFLQTRAIYPNDGMKILQGELKSEILRVAAYCRVSSYSDSQEDSLENQTVHYTRYIRANSNWRFIGIYSDQGKTGTKIDSRSGFQRLIRHALEGKVDLILCKSISRFARNVIDALDTIRLLKENGVRVIFEKENIDTASMQSEFIITLLGAIAQEESRSISENIKWAHTKRFQRGAAIFIRILGYQKNDKKEWIVVKEEAEIVKEAFTKYLEGLTISEIARSFISKGYKKVNGRTDWSYAIIRDMLKNEKYVGDVLCQKTYTKDHLSHEAKKNDGNKNQYLITNHHEAIIDRATFQKVQEKLSNARTYKKRGERKTYPLSGRIICSECGGNLQHFDCRGLVTWRCGNRVKSKSICSFDGIKEKYLNKAIIKSLKKHYQINKLEKVAIQNMIKDIKNAEVSGDIEYNKLRIELERVLFQENMLVLKGNSPEKDKEALRVKRETLENEINIRKIWWDMIESDSKYRAEALEKLELISRMEKPLEALEEYFKGEKCIEFLRAWVVRIKAVSPIKISIEWIDGKVSNATLPKGEGRIDTKRKWS